MYVCICNGVTDHQIREAAQSGVASVSELTMRTGCGATCGSCLDMAADLQLNSRLGCQAQITKPGKVVVEIPAWNRNYVSEEHH